MIGDAVHSVKELPSAGRTTLCVIAFRVFLGGVGFFPVLARDFYKQNRLPKLYCLPKEQMCSPPS